MTGGQALAKSLVREGVRVVFGLPGAGQYEAIDGIYGEPDLTYISTRHEQSTSYMADGYARASGKIAAIVVLPGPGLYNASAGIASANSVSSPMLIVSGAQQERGASDITDDLAWVRPITKWASKAGSPADVPTVVHEAFRQFKVGRPGPVYVEVPHHVLAAEADLDLMEPAKHEPMAPGPESIERGARALAAAKRPAILAGGGVVISGASAALQRLAEHLRAPVLTTAEGKGAISDRHPLCLGFLELRYEPLKDWLAEHDVVLAVGVTRANTVRLPDHQIVQIDVDDREILRDRPNAVGIVGDPRLSLEGLHRAVAATRQRESEAKEVEAIRAERFDPAAQLEPQDSLMRAVRAAIPDDGVFVSGMTQMGYYSRNYYPVYDPRTYLTASGYGTLGLAFPVAMGAKVAEPHKAVVAVSGDGGFLYNSQELATAVQYGINVVVVVFNDNAYGNVLRAQLKEFGGRVIGTRLHNPDFARLAEVYGARGVRANGAEQLESNLREAFDTDSPTLIEVPVGMMDRRF